MIRLLSIIPLLVVLISPMGTSAQTDSTKIELEAKHPPTYKFEAGIEANYGSTNLNNEFIQKLLFGGKIETSLKDRVLDRTNKRNRFGLEINYEARFIDLSDTVFVNLPNYRYYIGFGSYNNLSASYTHDLFNTVFYGNKQFENQTAELGKSNFTSYKFEKITIGLMSRDSSHSFGVSLIIGDRYNGYNFKRADMFTHPEGTDITMNYEGSVRLSDPERGGFMSFAGAGIGLDYMTQLVNNRYTFSVTNFGVAFWQRNTSYSNTELEYNFDGIEIDNVFQTSSEEIETKALAILPELREKGFVTFLPTIVRFDKNINPENKFQPIYGLRYKFFSNYLPQIYGGYSYQASDKLRFSSNLTWGGYAGLRAGIGAYYTNKRLMVGLQSTNFTGMFIKFGNGNGGSIFACYYF